MRITVIGAGAVGLLYAARLALSGAEVAVATRTAEQAGLLQERGISFKDASGFRTAAVEAFHLGREDTAAQRRPGWFILTVKQTALHASLLEELRGLIGPEDSLLCLQNGIGHMERLERALPPGTTLYAGTVSEGALREDARTVVHTGEGELYYGLLNNASVQVHSASLLEEWQLSADKAGIRALLSKDMNDRIYHKLLLNAVINPLTALYGIRNGELPGHPQGGLLMHALHEETMAVLARAGMAVEGNEHERLLQVCRLTAHNISSMLADIQGGRRSEIDSISGAVAVLAERHGLEAPLNRAAAAMIKALEPLRG